MDDNERRTLTDRWIDRNFMSVYGAWRDPHWIVVAAGSLTKVGGQPRKRAMFCHGTQESAERECERLAKLHPGFTYTVYASGLSRKIYTPTDPEGGNDE